MIESKKRKPKWHLFYYALAFFDLLTISVSLFMNHNLVNIYSESVKLNSKWSHLMQDFSKLNTLASEANGPGNNVFENRDEPGMRAELKRTSNEFIRHYKHIDVNLRNDHYGNDLLTGFHQIELHFSRMTAEANNVLDAFSARKETQAAANMAEMDQHYGKISHILSDLQRKVGDMQIKILQKQLKTALRLRLFEYMLAVSVVIIIVLVVIYGHLMSKKVMEYEKERESRESTEASMLQKMKLAAESAGFGIWEWSIVENRLDWDDNMFALYGITRDKFTSNYEAWKNVVHPEDLPQATHHLELALSGRHHFDSNFRVVHPNGAVRHIKASGNVLRDDKGRAIKMIGINYDITERKQEEQNQKSIAGKLQMAVDAAGMGIWEWNIVENISTWDDGMLRIYGLKKGEHGSTYQDWQNGVHPEDRKRAHQDIETALKGERDYDTHFRILRTDGEIRHIKAKGIIVRDESGKPVRMVGINYDTTESVLHEDLLKKAKMDAEAASVAKGQFLANMSHEIRTPLNGILGSVKLMMDSKDAGEIKELNNMIYHSASSLLSIINDILDLSKIEAGKMLLEELSLDFKMVLGDVINLFKNQASDKGLHLKVEYPEHAPQYIISDPTRLRQVLINLVSNAMKFTERGGVDIAVSFSPLKDGYHMLKCEVHDSGIGMSREQMEIIFNDFVQAEAGTTRKYGGTGLGTAISKKIVDMMKGRIWVTSQPGSGSCFAFEVRVRGTNEKHLHPLQSGNLECNYGRRVLLAEDNAINSKVASKNLKKLGLEVLLAMNGRQVLEIADQPHDLILMDIQMPEMDGIEACRVLRQKGYSKPIIAMTANIFAEDIARYRAAGMQDHVPKPFTTEQLVAVLDKHLA